VAAGMKGMTSGNAKCCEGKPFNGTMGRDGMSCVVPAAGVEPARGGKPRPNGGAVEIDKSDQDKFHQRSSPAFFQSSRRSRSASARPFQEHPDRGYATISTPGRSSERRKRKVSRSRRLRRLRLTAPPTFALTESPSRGSRSEASTRCHRMSERPTVFLPDEKTCRNSRRSLSRASAPKPGGGVKLFS